MGKRRGTDAGEAHKSAPRVAPPREARKPKSLLSYWKAGTGEGIRTLDPNFGKVVLYGRGRECGESAPMTEMGAKRPPTKLGI